MKNLKDFLAEQINTKSIIGGRNIAPTYATQQDRHVDGCSYMRKDWYCDSNSNGKQDSNEPCGNEIKWTFVCCVGDE